MRLSPRGVVGQLAAFVERTVSDQRSIASTAARCRVAPGARQSLRARHVPTPGSSGRQHSCRRLRRVGFDPSIVKKLASTSCAAPTARCARYGRTARRRWGADRAETLDVFIHAAHEGLPRAVVGRHLPDLPDRARVASRPRAGEAGWALPACATSFERDLAGPSARLHPAPERAQDRTRDVLRGAPARRPHVVVQQVLNPGEERTVALDFRRGTYRIADVVATVDGESSRARSASNDGDTNTNSDRVELRPSVVRGGKSPSSCATRTTHRRSASRSRARARRCGGRDRDDAPVVSFALFGQLLADGEHVRVQHLAFLFVELIVRVHALRPGRGRPRPAARPPARRDRP